METLIWIVLVVLVVAGVGYYLSTRSKARDAEIGDAAAEARRWVERLGGQVYSLDAKGDAVATQALSDASERFTAAGSQVEQASTVQQYRLAQQTAYEGLYYVEAARSVLGLAAGPALPAIPGQAQAGAVTEDRRVDVEGHEYEASPKPGERTKHYYPGGDVAGRPVPQGWYSEPWWRPALVAGAWGVGTYLVASTLFAGMAGTGGWESGYADGYADGAESGDGSGDSGEGGYGDEGSGDSGYGDGSYGDGGDSGGFGDFGGGDSGGFGDFGGGDF